MMDDLLRQHFVGWDGYTWWVGQIAPEETWKNNIPGQPEPDNTSILGFSERYRVRIMGYHTDSTFDVADEELPWKAYIMYSSHCWWWRQRILSVIKHRCW